MAILERSETFPSVLAAPQSVRTYPQPYAVNAAHLLGYLSHVTEGELSAAKSSDSVTPGAAG